MRNKILLVGAAATALLTVLSVPASAAVPSPALSGSPWAGYEVTTTTPFTSITAAWTQPATTCLSINDGDALWLGLDGINTSTVEQMGVETDCSGGTAVFQGWYEMYPAAPVYLSTTTRPVSAGDGILATIGYSGGAFTLTMVDKTKGWTFTVTKASTASRLSAEVLLESPDSSWPKFGTINVTGVKISGKTLGSLNPTAVNADNGIVQQVLTGPIANGTDFTLTWLHE